MRCESAARPFLALHRAMGRKRSHRSDGAVGAGASSPVAFPGGDASVVETRNFSALTESPSKVKFGAVVITDGTALGA